MSTYSGQARVLHVDSVFLRRQHHLPLGCVTMLLISWHADVGRASGVFPRVVHEHVCLSGT